MLLLCLFCHFLNPTALFSQGENNNWIFGKNVFLSFNSSVPLPYISNLHSTEGSAAVSNNYGALLFYSDGRNVWDAAYNVMPNGGGLLGNQLTSSSQGVQIVQFPDNKNKYYLFVLDALLNVGFSGYTDGALRYSVIDMTLNGGMGDIVAGEKNMLLGSGYSEQMTITPGPSCSSAWLVVRDTASSIHSYLIDPSGINPVPVTSAYPAMPGAGRIGELKIAHDGSRLAWASHNAGFVMIGSFDPLSGLAGNFQVISGQAYQPYGLEFSPDGSRLYVAYSPVVKQYDLNLLPNLSSFLNSAYDVTLAGPYSFMSMRTGPDQKIYFNRNSNNPIYAIRNPDLAGAACNVDTAAVQCVATTAPLIGLGANAFIFPQREPVAGIVSDTVICFAETFRLDATPGFNSYTWSNGDTTDHTFLTNNAKLWVRYTDDTACTIRTDTIGLAFERFTVDLGNDTTICGGDSIVLDASLAQASFRWQDGSDQPLYSGVPEGVYKVAVSRNGCTLQDSITIKGIYPYLKILQADTIICKGSAITLEVRTDMPEGLRWNTGVQALRYTVSEAGTYTVTAAGACGTLGDSVHIDLQRCDCTVFIPTAFSPNGDGLNDLFRVEVPCRPAQFQLRVFNRYGQQVFEGWQKEKGWDGLYRGIPVEAGTYFYVLTFFGSDGKNYSRKGDITLIR